MGYVANSPCKNRSLYISSIKPEMSRLEEKCKCPRTVWVNSEDSCGQETIFYPANIKSQAGRGGREPKVTHKWTNYLLVISGKSDSAFKIFTL